MNPRLQGVACALLAYLLWGILPVYWKCLQSLDTLEILAHRIVWSVAFLALLLTLRREWPAFRRAVTTPATLRRYSLAAILLALNWGLYIYCVNHDRIVEASLGYYINPLVSVLLGTLVLQERLRRTQWIAVALAAAGVLQLTLQQGNLPWTSLTLALTFGLYGLTKKLSPLHAVPGLALETAVLLTPALASLGWFQLHHQAAFGHASLSTHLLLLLAGIVTSLPLLLFAHAAQRVPLSTLGLLQYLAPTCSLLLGVLAYQEPFPPARALGFALIWIALALFSLENLAKCWPTSRPNH